jgi:hypothetical protein
MARTTITPEVVPTGFPLTKETVVWTDSDPSNGNRFAHTGKEIVQVYNSGASTRTVKFQSVAINGRLDPLHNTTINVAAGELAIFNLRGEGWRQPSGDDSGFVQIDGSHAELKLMVIQTPA